MTANSGKKTMVGLAVVALLSGGLFIGWDRAKLRSPDNHPTTSTTHAHNAKAPVRPSSAEPADQRLATPAVTPPTIPDGKQITDAQRRVLKAAILAEKSKGLACNWQNIFRSLDEDPTLVNDYECELLQFAAMCDFSPDILNELFTRGADVLASPTSQFGWLDMINISPTQQTDVRKTNFATVVKLFLDHIAISGAFDDEDSRDTNRSVYLSAPLAGLARTHPFTADKQEAAALLLAAGADACDSQQSPLLHACLEPHNKDWIEWLLANGTAADRINATYAPLISLCSYDPDRLADNIEALIAAGADVNATDPNGKTPLMMILQQYGNLTGPTAQLLLQYGADISSTTANGYTALHALASGGHNELMEDCLKNGFSPNVATTAGVTPIMEAVASGKADTIALLVKYGAVCDPNTLYSDGTSLISAAAQSGNPNVMSQLLSLGINVKSLDSYGKTAMDYALDGRCSDMFDWLLQHGVDASNPNAVVDNISKPPTSDPILHSVLRGHNTRMIEYLLNRGADANANDSLGMSPLWSLAIYSGNTTESALIGIATLLIQHGANVNVRQSTGMSLLDVCEHIESAKCLIPLLRRHGAAAVDQSSQVPSQR